jgi:hypothetical protein
MTGLQTSSYVAEQDSSSLFFSRPIFDPTLSTMATPSAPQSSSSRAHASVLSKRPPNHMMDATVPLKRVHSAPARCAADKEDDADKADGKNVVVASSSSLPSPEAAVVPGIAMRRSNSRSAESTASIASSTASTDSTASTASIDGSETATFVCKDCVEGNTVKNDDQLHVCVSCGEVKHSTFVSTCRMKQCSRDEDDTVVADVQYDTNQLKHDIFNDGRTHITIESAFSTVPAFDANTRRILDQPFEDAALSSQQMFTRLPKHSKDLKNATRLLTQPAKAAPLSTTTTTTTTTTTRSTRSTLSTLSTLSAPYASGPVTTTSGSATSATSATSASPVDAAAKDTAAAPSFLCTAFRSRQVFAPFTIHSPSLHHPCIIGIVVVVASDDETFLLPHNAPMMHMRRSLRESARSAPR